MTAEKLRGSVLAFSRLPFLFDFLAFPDDVPDEPYQMIDRVQDNEEGDRLEEVFLHGASLIYVVDSLSENRYTGPQGFSRDVPISTASDIR